jgi:hypothetical protein
MAFAVAALSCAGGCRGSIDPPGAATSPQAKAEPTPLATPSPVASGNGALLTADAGRPPLPLAPDTELTADNARELVREQGSKEVWREARDLPGLSLQASLRTGEGPGPPKTPEVNTIAIDGARRRTEDRLVIELSQNRARFELTGAFPLPAGAELRARSDRYGHLLLCPEESTYRVVQPGALRALLGERRADVAPMSTAEVRQTGEGPRRFNLRSRRVEIATRAAKATLDVVTVRDSGAGGDLVCHFLLDLMSAAPSTQACATDEVPVHAELRWTKAGALTFDVFALTPRNDLSPQELAVPPQGRTLDTSPLAPLQADAFLQKPEMAGFRTAPVDIAVPGPREAQPLSPDAGLLLVNATDELRVAWLDGVPLAWVSPSGRLALPALVRGRYALQWRTVLGDSWSPADFIVVPGTSEAK